jgi:hypothetical protein
MIRGDTYTPIPSFKIFSRLLRLGACIQKVKIDSDTTNLGMFLHTPNEDVGSEKKIGALQK